MTVACFFLKKYEALEVVLSPDKLIDKRNPDQAVQQILVHDKSIDKHRDNYLKPSEHAVWFQYPDY